MSVLQSDRESGRRRRKVNTLRRGGLAAKRKSPFDQPTTKIVKQKANGESVSFKRRGYAVGADGPTNETRQHLEPGELRAFFRFMPPTSYWYSYFYIQYFYGCRLSEPALILDEDVSFKKNLILIRRLKKSREEEGFRQHVYKADPRILECVKVAQRWKEVKKMEGNPFLFPSNRKHTRDEVGAERLSQLRNLDGWQAISRFTAHRMFQKIGEAVKLPDGLCQSHVLRHTRAVIMLASGGTLEQVRDALGHSSIKMTQRYLGAADGVRSKISPALATDLSLMGLGL